MVEGVVKHLISVYRACLHSGKHLTLGIQIHNKIDILSVSCIF